MREMVCGDAIACRGTDEEEALEVVCRLQVRSTFFLAVFRVLFVRSIPFPRPHISVCNGDVWCEAWHPPSPFPPVSPPASLPCHPVWKLRSMGHSRDACCNGSPTYPWCDLCCRTP